MSAQIAVFETNARVAPFPAVHRVWCFDHAGCAPTRITLYGLTAQPDSALQGQLDQAAAAVGLRRAEFAQPFPEHPAAGELALVVEVQGCQAAKDAAFEFAAAICRYFPNQGAGVRVQFTESPAERLPPKARCAAAVIPATPRHPGAPRRRHAHSRLHA